MFTFILSIVGVVIGCIFYPVGNYLSEKKLKDKNLEAEVELYGLGMMLLGEVLFFNYKNIKQYWKKVWIKVKI